MNGFSVLGEHYSAVNLSLASFSEGSCFFPVLSIPFPTSLDFASLKKGTAALIWKVLQKWTSESQLFLFFILLYVRCPEITQKIMGLGESPLKITEHLIKFLLGSKINAILHRLCPVVHVLTLSCSPVLDLFFYVVIRLESSFENKTKPPLPPNLDAHGYLKTKQHFRSNS